MAYSKTGNWHSALNDANYVCTPLFAIFFLIFRKVISLQPEWSKGYARKGLALQGQGKLGEALYNLQLGLTKDPKDDPTIKAIIGSIPPDTVPVVPEKKLVVDHDDDENTGEHASSSTSNEKNGGEDKKKGGLLGSFLKKKK